MDELDLYDDLDAFHEEQEKKSKELNDLEEKYAKAQENIASLEEEKKGLHKKIHRIELSFQSLLDTARREINRKDKEIDRLRKENDDICFRRKFPNRAQPAKDFAEERHAVTALSKEKSTPQAYEEEVNLANQHKSESVNRTKHDHSSESFVGESNKRHRPQDDNDSHYRKRHRDDRGHSKSMEHARHRHREPHKSDRNNDSTHRNERNTKSDRNNDSTHRNERNTKSDNFTHERSRQHYEHQSHRASKSPSRGECRRSPSRDDRTRSRFIRYWQRSPSRKRSSSRKEECDDVKSTSRSSKHFDDKDKSHKNSHSKQEKLKESMEQVAYISLSEGNRKPPKKSIVCNDVGNFQHEFNAAETVQNTSATKYRICEQEHFTYEIKDSLRIDLTKENQSLNTTIGENVSKQRDASKSQEKQKYALKKNDNILLEKHLHENINDKSEQVTSSMEMQNILYGNLDSVIDRDDFELHNDKALNVPTQTSKTNQTKKLHSTLVDEPEPDSQNNDSSHKRSYMAENKGELFENDKGVGKTTRSQQNSSKGDVNITASREYWAQKTISTTHKSTLFDALCGSSPSSGGITDTNKSLPNKLVDSLSQEENNDAISTAHQHVNTAAEMTEDVQLKKFDKAKFEECFIANTNKTPNSSPTPLKVIPQNNDISNNYFEAKSHPSVTELKTPDKSSTNTSPGDSSNDWVIVESPLKTTADDLSQQDVDVENCFAKITDDNGINKQPEATATPKNDDIGEQSVNQNLLTNGSEFSWTKESFESTNNKQTEGKRTNIIHHSDITCDLNAAPAKSANNSLSPKSCNNMAHSLEENKKQQFDAQEKVICLNNACEEKPRPLLITDNKKSQQNDCENTLIMDSMYEKELDNSSNCTVLKVTESYAPEGNTKHLNKPVKVIGVKQQASNVHLEYEDTGNEKDTNDITANKKNCDPNPTVHEENESNSSPLRRENNHSTIAETSIAEAGSNEALISEVDVIGDQETSGNFRNDNKNCAKTMCTNPSGVSMLSPNETSIVQGSHTERGCEISNKCTANYTPETKTMNLASTPQMPGNNNQKEDTSVIGNKINLSNTANEKNASDAIGKEKSVQENNVHEDNVLNSDRTQREYNHSVISVILATKAHNNSILSNIDMNDDQQSNRNFKSYNENDTKSIVASPNDLSQHSQNDSVIVVNSSYEEEHTNPLKCAEDCAPVTNSNDLTSISETRNSKMPITNDDAENSAPVTSSNDLTSISETRNSKVPITNGDTNIKTLIETGVFSINTGKKDVNDINTNENKILPAPSIHEGNVCNSEPSEAHIKQSAMLETSASTNDDLEVISYINKQFSSTATNYEKCTNDIKAIEKISSPDLFAPEDEALDSDPPHDQKEFLPEKEEFLPETNKLISHSSDTAASTEIKKYVNDFRAIEESSSPEDETVDCQPPHDTEEFLPETNKITSHSPDTAAHTELKKYTNDRAIEKRNSPHLFTPGDDGLGSDPPHETEEFLPVINPVISHNSNTSDINENETYAKDIREKGKSGAPDSNEPEGRSLDSEPPNEKDEFLPDTNDAISHNSDTAANTENEKSTLLYDVKTKGKRSAPNIVAPENKNFLEFDPPKSEEFLPETNEVINNKSEEFLPETNEVINNKTDPAGNSNDSIFTNVELSNQQQQSNDIFKFISSKSPGKLSICVTNTTVLDNSTLQRNEIVTIEDNAELETTNLQSETVIQNVSPPEVSTQSIGNVTTAFATNLSATESMQTKGTISYQDCDFSADNVPRPVPVFATDDDQNKQLTEVEVPNATNQKVIYSENNVFQTIRSKESSLGSTCLNVINNVTPINIPGLSLISTMDEEIQVRATTTDISLENKQQSKEDHLLHSNSNKFSENNDLNSTANVTNACTSKVLNETFSVGRNEIQAKRNDAVQLVSTIRDSCDHVTGMTSQIRQMPQHQCKSPVYISGSDLLQSSKNPDVSLRPSSQNKSISNFSTSSARGGVSESGIESVNSLIVTYIPPKKITGTILIPGLGLLDSPMQGDVCQRRSPITISDVAVESQQTNGRVVAGRESTLPMDDSQKKKTTEVSRVLEIMSESTVSHKSCISHTDPLLLRRRGSTDLVSTEVLSTPELRAAGREQQRSSTPASISKTSVETRKYNTHVVPTQMQTSLPELGAEARERVIIRSPASIPNLSVETHNSNENVDKQISHLSTEDSQRKNNNKVSSTPQLGDEVREPQIIRSTASISNIHIESQKTNDHVGDIQKSPLPTNESQKDHCTADLRSSELGADESVLQKRSTQSFEVCQRKSPDLISTESLSTPELETEVREQQRTISPALVSIISVETQKHNQYILPMQKSPLPMYHSQNGMTTEVSSTPELGVEEIEPQSINPPEAISNLSVENQKANEHVIAGQNSPLPTTDSQKDNIEVSSSQELGAEGRDPQSITSAASISVVGVEIEKTNENVSRLKSPLSTDDSQKENSTVVLRTPELGAEETVPQSSCISYTEPLTLREPKNIIESMSADIRESQRQKVKKPNSNEVENVKNVINVANANFPILHNQTSVYLPSKMSTVDNSNKFCEINNNPIEEKPNQLSAMHLNKAKEAAPLQQDKINQSVKPPCQINNAIINTVLEANTSGKPIPSKACESSPLFIDALNVYSEVMSKMTLSGRDATSEKTFSDFDNIINFERNLGLAEKTTELFEKSRENLKNLFGKHENSLMSSPNKFLNPFIVTTPKTPKANAVSLIETNFTATDISGFPNNLPSVSTKCPTPPNFSGIFSKIPRTDSWCDEHIVYKIRSPQGKTFIIPAVSVLCNVDNLQIAAKASKKLHWETLENINERKQFKDGFKVNNSEEEQLERPRKDGIYACAKPTTISSMKSRKAHKSNVLSATIKSSQASATFGKAKLQKDLKRKKLISKRRNTIDSPTPPPLSDDTVEQFRQLAIRQQPLSSNELPRNEITKWDNKLQKGVPGDKLDNITNEQLQYLNGNLEQVLPIAKKKRGRPPKQIIAENKNEDKSEIIHAAIQNKGRSLTDGKVNKQDLMMNYEQKVMETIDKNPGHLNPKGPESSLLFKPAHCSALKNYKIPKLNAQSNRIKEEFLNCNSSMITKIPKVLTATNFSVECYLMTERCQESNLKPGVEDVKCTNTVKERMTQLPHGIQNNWLKKEKQFIHNSTKSECSVDITSNIFSPETIINEDVYGECSNVNTYVNPRPRRKSMYALRSTENDGKSSSDNTLCRMQRPRRKSFYLAMNSIKADCDEISSVLSSDETTKEYPMKKRRKSVNHQRRKFVDISSEEQEDDYKERTKLKRNKEPKATKDYDYQIKENKNKNKIIKNEMDDKKTPEPMQTRSSRAAGIDRPYGNNNENDEILYDQYIQAQNEFLRLEKLVIAKQRQKAIFNTQSSDSKMLNFDKTLTKVESKKDTETCKILENNRNTPLNRIQSTKEDGLGEGTKNVTDKLPPQNVLNDDKIEKCALTNTVPKMFKNNEMNAYDSADNMVNQNDRKLRTRRKSMYAESFSSTATATETPHIMENNKSKPCELKESCNAENKNMKNNCSTSDSHLKPIKSLRMLKNSKIIDKVPPESAKRQTEENLYNNEIASTTVIEAETVVNECTLTNNHLNENDHKPLDKSHEENFDAYVSNTPLKHSKTKNLKRRILDTSGSESDEMEKHASPILQTVIAKPSKTPELSQAKVTAALRKKRIVRVLSTSLKKEEQKLEAMAKKLISTPDKFEKSTSASPNHAIFYAQVSEETPLNMTTLSNDDRFNEMDSQLRVMFQSPQHDAESVVAPPLEDSPKIVNTLATQTNGINATNVCTNQENDAASSLNDSKSLSTLASSDKSTAKHLSLGSSDYRFEKVSENVVNLFISRKRKRRYKPSTTN